MYRNKHFSFMRLVHKAAAQFGTSKAQRGLKLWPATVPLRHYRYEVLCKVTIRFQSFREQQKMLPTVLAMTKQKVAVKHYIMHVLTKVCSVTQGALLDAQCTWSALPVKYAIHNSNKLSTFYWRLTLGEQSPLPTVQVARSPRSHSDCRCRVQLKCF